MFKLFDLHKISNQQNFLENSVIKNALLSIKDNTLDYLLLRNSVLLDALPPTPTDIKNGPPPKYAAQILREILQNIGKIDDKNFENTIRFSTKNQYKNEETWHNHNQFSFTAFLCLRGDINAKTHVISANEIIQSKDSTVSELLMKKHKYISTHESFGIIEESNGFFTFSNHLFESSDLEKVIQNLEMKDITKACKLFNNKNTDAIKAISCLKKILQKPKHIFTYQPGDIIILNEKSTIRYSPEYLPNNDAINDRWLLTLSAHEFT